MLTKPVAVALLAAGCVAAAGGGAYLAVRHSTPVADVPVAAAAAPVVTEGAVRETEGLIAAEEMTAAPEAAPAAVEAERREAAAARAERARPARAAAGRSEPAPRPAPAPVAAPVEPSWSSHDRPAEPAPEPEWQAPSAWDPPVRYEPMPQFDDLVVTADSVIGLQIETPATSERARVEDRIEARVTRDVLVDGRVAVPAGTRVVGSVTQVERGGKIKERARLGVRFHTLVLADGSRLNIQTETLFREGESPAKDSTAKIGGAAAGGAVLGAILGGTRGAVLGGAAGAAGGTAATMAGDRNAATLPAGATVTVRLTAPVTVTIER
jgi:hypothetical protein